MFFKFLFFLFIFLIPTTQAAENELRRDGTAKSDFLLAETKDSNGKIIKTVVASGFGASFEAATQNAAENALIQVVGSFIDAETLIKKKTEIRDGVISTTKVIKKDIKDYSQGSIKYFEILNIQENKSIFNITARVDIRIEDFRSYIEELASDTKEIDSGLFASIRTDEENIENKIDLLEKVLNPLIKGQVTKINIGEAQRLIDLSAFNCKYIYEYKRIYCPIGGRNETRTGGWNMSPKGSIVIPITFDLDEDYKKNSINILENISNQKFSGSIRYRTYPGKFENFDEKNDYAITLVNSKNNTFKSYLLSDAKEYNEKRKVVEGKKSIPVSPRSYCWKNYYPKIKLSLLDKNKDSVWEQKFKQCDGANLNLSDNQVSVSFFYVSPDKNNGLIDPIFPNLYYGLSSGGNSMGELGQNVIFEHSRLLLIIEPEENLLNKISQIKLEYVTN